MGLILDTSVLIGAERGRFDLAALFQAHASEAFFIAAITASELLHGVERADSADRRLKRSRFVEGVLREVPVLEFDLSIARKHARLWADLERIGKVVGPHDMLVAATAMLGDHALATLNRDEFARVEGLVLADVAEFEIPV